MDFCLGESTLSKEDLLVDIAVELKKEYITKTPKPKNRVIVLGGPTASGKSAFSLELVKVLGGEIVSADSMQIYEGMDIGTATPTLEERCSTPHHLVSVKKIFEPFNVVDFYREAVRACENILSRKSVPIIVGGSGFYLHSLIYGPPSGPPPNLEVRKKLEEELEKKGIEELYKKILLQDPKYAKSITPNDSRKILRALEIIAITGKPPSHFQKKDKLIPKKFDFRCWFLYRPRESLYERIDRRCDEMIERGFLEEVEKLIEQGLLDNPTASQSIGYRQAIDYLNSPKTQSDYEKFVYGFKKGTKAYVKRQFTWFRKELLFRWLDLEMHDPEVAMEIVRQDYEYGI